MLKSEHISSISLDHRRFTAQILAARQQERANEANRQHQTQVSYLTIPDVWPAALTWKMALVYSNMSPTFLRKLIKQEKLIFKPLGPRCSKIVLRADLDKVLLETFSSDRICTRIEEDFDFG